MICEWCHRNMTARKGKRYCSDKCRVAGYRYDEAFAKFQRLLRECNKLYNQLAVVKELPDDAT
jgi:hypothetical protein